MAKNTTSKSNKLYNQWFFLGLFSSKFPFLYFPAVPMGSTNWVIAGDAHSGIVNLYLKDFHQSYICTHIKEGCIT